MVEYGIASSKSTRQAYPARYSAKGRNNRSSKPGKNRGNEDEEQAPRRGSKDGSSNGGNGGGDDGGDDIEQIHRKTSQEDITSPQEYLINARVVLTEDMANQLPLLKTITRHKMDDLANFHQEEASYNRLVMAPVQLSCATDDCWENRESQAVRRRREWNDRFRGIEERQREWQRKKEEEESKKRHEAKEIERKRQRMEEDERKKIQKVKKLRKAKRFSPNSSDDESILLRKAKMKDILKRLQRMRQKTKNKTGDEIAEAGNAPSSCRDKSDIGIFEDNCDRVDDHWGDSAGEYVWGSSDDVDDEFSETDLQGDKDEVILKSMHDLATLLNEVG